MQRLAIGPALMTVALTATVCVQVMATTGAGPALAASAPASPHAMPGPMSAAAMKKAPPAVPERLVDINSASRKELMTLPGIGAAEATKIIANRPYLTKTELVTKQVLLTGPFLSLKNKVVAMQKFKPVTGKKPQAANAGRVASGSKAP